MNYSEKGLKFLIKLEGFKKYPYKDVKGILTIGVGHIVRPIDKFIYPLSDDHVINILKEDIEREGFVNNINNLNICLNQAQFDACFSLSFNIGSEGFCKSTIVKMLRADNVLGAADAFLLWKRAGNNLDVLLPRRIKERKLFLTGFYEGVD
jgi:lysozyme